MVRLDKRLVVLAVGVCAISSAACDPAFGIKKFQEPGPEPVQRMTVGDFTLFLGSTDGDPKPGLTWGNGTGASPGSYVGILNRVASYGVQVVASNSQNTGTGVEMQQGIDVLLGGGFNVGGPFCASGHSQGGSGTVNSSVNANVVCSIPVEPDNRFTASSNGRDIKGPALILCGSTDGLAPCGAPNAATNGSGLYNQANVPVTQITVTGVGHFEPVGAGGIFAALVTAQTQAVLKNDADAQAALFGPRPGATALEGLQDIRSKNFPGQP